MREGVVLIALLLLLALVACGQGMPSDFEDIYIHPDVVLIDNLQSVDLASHEFGWDIKQKDLTASFDLNSEDLFVPLDSQAPDFVVDSQPEDLTTGKDLRTSEIPFGTDTNDQDTGSDASTNELRLYKSGSRIKAKVLKTSDGAQSFLGWYDTELSTDCIFWYSTYKAEDGKNRCLPRSAVVSSSNYYTDSNCSKPLWYASVSETCAYGTEWISLNNGNAADKCTYPLTVFQNPHQYSGSVLYSKETTGCVEDSDNFILTSGFYVVFDSLGQKVAPEVFAEATTELAE